MNFADRFKGGCAFPNITTNGSDSDAGLSQHQYFAGQALAGFCANPAVFASNPQCGFDLVNCSYDQLAQLCNWMADSMIKVENDRLATFKAAP